MLRAAQPQDRPRVEALLRQADLPLAGLDETRLWVFEVDGDLQGAVGLERHGKSTLLRSLVVHPHARGAGAGTALLERAVIEATKSGATRVAALTTTIAPWLEREGWKRVAREQLPAELSASQELNRACPASAAAFILELAKPALAA